VYNSNEGQELRGKKEAAQEEEEDGSKGGTMQMLTTPTRRPRLCDCELADVNS
jgi:hypothetical protein